MDSASPVTGMFQSTKPLAGLVVVLYSVTVIGGWLYVDSVRNELEMKINATSPRVIEKTVVEPAQASDVSSAARFTYRGLSFEIPGDWNVDRTASEGDAIFTDRHGSIIAELDCRAQSALAPSPFDTVVAERITQPDGTKAQLYRHQSLGDSDVPPRWTLQMEYMSETAPCRLDARVGTVDQGVMERALESLTMAELY